MTLSFILAGNAACAGDQQISSDISREGATSRSSVINPEVAAPTAMLPGNVPMQFKKVPAGRFQMRSLANEKDREADEGPVHEVTITRPFYLGIY